MTAQVAAWLMHRGRLLDPDFDQAEGFLEALDPAARCFSFRTFSDTPYTRVPGRDPLERELHGRLEDLWDGLCRLNRRGAAIGVTVNSTHCRGRGRADVVGVRALFLDDDRGLGRAAFPLPPHVTVLTSPGRFHHYWRVAGLDPGAFEELQQRLAHAWGGDRRVCALNQSMQVPGFWRRKDPAHPRLPRLWAVRPGVLDDRQAWERLTRR